MLVELTSAQVYKRLELAVVQAGSATALSKKWGISAAYLSDIRCQKRNMSETILDLLNIKRVVAYIADDKEDRP
jgi:hypothetical protein